MDEVLLLEPSLDIGIKNRHPSMLCAEACWDSCSMTSSNWLSLMSESKHGEQVTLQQVPGTPQNWKQQKPLNQGKEAPRKQRPAARMQATNMTTGVMTTGVMLRMAGLLTGCCP